VDALSFLMFVKRIKEDYQEVGPGQPGNMVSLENQEYLVNLENLVSLGNQDNRLYQKFCN